MSGEARTLPDFALTAFEAGGWEVLPGLVAAGLLEAGDYECPACRGTGEEKLDLLVYFCEACQGDGYATLSATCAVRGP